jgi:glycosyltransferase involved in cell wall biosynthesis
LHLFNEHAALERFTEDSLTMLACISKNDRAGMLFAELRKLRPDLIDLGSVRPARLSKLLGAISALTTDIAQWRTDMDFSPIVARDMQARTWRKIRRHPGISHVLQWGAMYAPAAPDSPIAYSIVTDGPYDPDDQLYPVEWRPVRWSREYFARQRAIYSGARTVFTLTAWARNKLLALHPLDPDHVIRIGWGPMFTVDRPNLILTEPPYFVSIGNQWQRKGMDLVAQAGHQLHLQHPSVHTIIAGEPRGLSIPPVAGVVQRPYKHSLTQVKELIAGARALVVASRFDPSPHIVMEALQLGTPVIAADVGGISEALITPDSGRLFPPYDPNALREAMAAVLGDEVHRQRSGASESYLKSGGWIEAAQVIARTIPESH